MKRFTIAAVAALLVFGAGSAAAAEAAAYVIANFVLTNPLHYSAARCDSDVALDPGETALLSFTVLSTGMRDLAAGATIQVGTDGDVTLPNGGLVTLPALAAGHYFFVDMPVKLESAASTAEKLTLTVAFPQAGALPDDVIEPATMTEVLMVNLDVGPPTDSSDDMEVAQASQTDWDYEAYGYSDTGWVLADLDATFGTGQVWRARSYYGTTSLLTTPTFAVPVGGDFSMTFDHFYEFAPPDGGIFYDGAVMEISIDGGAFVDVAAAGGTFGAGEGYSGLAETLFPAPRMAWVDTNGTMAPVTLSFGNALAGHTAKIRFRIVTSYADGAFGWVVDNVVLNGITDPVFSDVIPEDGLCIPIVSAGASQTVYEGALVTLAGTAGDLDGDPLTIAWTQIAGQAITINNADTLAPTFTAPSVSSDTAITLQMAVSDGTNSSSDTVVITIKDSPVGGGAPGGAPGGELGGAPGGKLGGALGGELALLGLLALIRRRRTSACR